MKGFSKPAGARSNSNHIKDLASKDEGFVRRMKAANYGKWYIKPSEYNDKVKALANMTGQSIFK